MGALLLGCWAEGYWDLQAEPTSMLPADIKLTPMEFGNLQKMDDPTEQCEDPVPEPPRNCSTGSVSPGGNRGPAG